MGDAKKIMIVEDEALLAADIEEKLAGLGYDVIGTANSGEKALAKLEEQHPDLVLMDIQLKGTMDGVEVSHAIKETYSIPVVFMTAYSDNNYLERAKVTEPYGYLVKPVSLRDMHCAIEMGLYKSAMEKERARLQAEIKILQGILPICCCCKKIRDDNGYWSQVEEYLSSRTDAQFSHSYCPDCLGKVYEEAGLNPPDKK